MKKKANYIKPKIEKVIVDSQISLVMMTNETAPPSGPFGNNNLNDKCSNKQIPFKG